MNFKGWARSRVMIPLDNGGGRNGDRPSFPPAIFIGGRGRVVFPATKSNKQHKVQTSKQHSYEKHSLHQPPVYHEDIMQTASLILWTLICCSHSRFVVSFQQRRLHVDKNARAVRFTLEDDAHPTQCQRRHQPSTCLFGERQQSKWNAKYQELVAFQKKNGHLEVNGANDGSLYSWMRNQRRRREGVKGRPPLTVEQVKLLDNINFPWIPNPVGRRGLVEKEQVPRSNVREAKWNAKYQELVAFQKLHGHLEVKSTNDSSLQAWMCTQRRRRKSAKGTTPLTDEQIQLLDEIEFPWNPKRGRRSGTTPTLGERRNIETKWNAKYEELVTFRKKHGHLNVKSADDESLHSWMRAQRRRRKGVKRNAPLTDEQVRLLDKIDFPWNPKRGRRRGLIEKEWMRKYKKLAKFYNEHGNLKVKYRGSLYMWMRLQRRRRKGKKNLAPLSDEQIQLLDAIDFAWDPNKSKGISNEKWTRKYEELAEFYKRYGHLKVEYQSSLYRWVCVQRNKRKGRKGFAALTDKQIQLLDEIDFNWNPPKGPARPGAD